jgi:hypothetical protein
MTSNPEPRLETGVIQCGDDWPGVFIRGDNAAYYAFALSKAIEIVGPEEPFFASALTGLKNKLTESNVSSPDHDPSKIQHVTLNKETQT